MDKRISDVLNDLMKIDPAFKAHETELRKLVSELLLAKPDTRFDEQFAARLRSQLLTTRIKPMPTPSPYSSFFMSRMFYGVIGSALTILVVVPFTFVATQKTTSPEKPIVFNPFSPQVKTETTVLSPKQQISNKGMNAFGTLALLPTNNNPEIAPLNQDSTVSKSAPTQTTAPSMGVSSVAGGRGSGNVSIMPVRPVNAHYNVAYKGETLKLTENQGKVFMRTKGIDSSKQLADIINGSDFGLARISSFSELKLKNLTLAQDTANGYTVNVNFTEGSISINPNWQYWEAGKGMPQSTTTTIENSKLLAIATEFVRTHNIDISVYGTPRTQLGNYVIYPLVIDNKEVYDETGNAYGLMITIDPQSNRVSDVQNLTSQIYDSSPYTLETDFAAVLKVATSTFAQNVGVSSAETSSSTQTATLGTPKQVLMHYWLYDEKGLSSSELFIPALSFPVTYQNKADGMPKAIVVPLVKDFLGKHNSSHDGQREPSSNPQPE